MSQRMKKTLLFGSIGLFLLLTLFVALKLTTPIDTTFSKWVFQLHNPVFTAFFRFITDFGYIQILLILLVIILIVFHKYRFAYILPIHVTISVIFNMIFKNIFARPRPEMIRLIDEVGFSFPSGHAMVTMVAYGYLIYVVHHYIQQKWLRYSLIAFLIFIIVSVGLSRIYLGVHYLTDVLAGYSISLFYLLVVTKMKIFSLGDHHESMD